MVSNTDNGSARLACRPYVDFGTAILPVKLVKSLYPNAVIVPGSNPTESSRNFMRLLFK